MSTGPVDFFVDTDMLRDLGQELQALINALDGAGCRAAADPAAMGGDDVAGAVDRFLNRWGTGRADAVATLRRCLQCVDNAIDGYDTAERRLFLANTLGIDDGGRQ